MKTFFFIRDYVNSVGFSCLFTGGKTKTRENWISFRALQCKKDKAKIKKKKNHIFCSCFDVKHFFIQKWNQHTNWVSTEICRPKTLKAANEIRISDMQWIVPICRRSNRDKQCKNWLHFSDARRAILNSFSDASYCCQLHSFLHFSVMILLHRVKACKKKKWTNKKRKLFDKILLLLVDFVIFQFLFFSLVLVSNDKSSSVFSFSFTE